MIRLDRNFLLISTIVALTSLATINDTARAFTLIDDTEPKWTVDEVSVNYNNNSCSTLSSAISDDIEEAVKFTWNSVPYSDLYLKLGSNNSVITSTDTENGSIQVFCSDLGSASILGQTGTSFTGDGEMVRAFFQINTGATFGSALTLQLTIAHEFGHAIGFGHSVKEEALMFFSLGSGQQRLAQDDVDAMVYLYNRNDITDGLLGCGAVDMNSGGLSGGDGNMAVASASLVYFLLMIASLYAIGRAFAGSPRSDTLYKRRDSNSGAVAHPL